MTIKQLTVLISSAALGLALLQLASAKGPSKILGRDAKGDAPAGLDLTWLGVGRFGDHLGVMIGINDAKTAALNHNLGHVMWAFDVDDRTFAVEAHVEGIQPRFDLYEITPSRYRQVGTGFRGQYDFINGFIGVLLPLERVGARPGSRVEFRVTGGTGRKMRIRICQYLHLGSSALATDVLDTTKVFVIP